MLTSAVFLGAGAIEGTLQASFAVAEAVRRETFHVAFSGIEFVKTFQQSATKVVRESISKLEKLSGEITDGVQETTLAIARTIRGSGELAADVVTRAAESLTGNRASAKAA